MVSSKFLSFSNSYPSLTLFTALQPMGSDQVQNYSLCYCQEIPGYKLGSGGKLQV